MMAPNAAESLINRRYYPCWMALLVLLFFDERKMAWIYLESLHPALEIAGACVKSSSCQTTSIIHYPFYEKKRYLIQC
jgi:hypothetical protein